MEPQKGAWRPRDWHSLRSESLALETLPGTKSTKSTNNANKQTNAKKETKNIDVLRNLGSISGFLHVRACQKLSNHDCHVPSESSESSEYPTCCSSSPGCQQDACPGSSWWDAWMHQASETEHYLFLSIYTYTYIIIYQYISIISLSISVVEAILLCFENTPWAESFLEIWQKNSPQCLCPPGPPQPSAIPPSHRVKLWPWNVPTKSLAIAFEWKFKKPQLTPLTQAASRPFSDWSLLGVCLCENMKTKAISLFSCIGLKCCDFPTHLCTCH